MIPRCFPTSYVTANGAGSANITTVGTVVTGTISGGTY